jgi:nucleoside-diphosphate-sugar epimerase
MSSLAASGPGYNDEVIAENRTPRPVTSYGRSKLEGERILTSLDPLPLIVVRPPAVYGPRDREILPLFKIAAKGVFPILNPESRMSLIHVQDLVEGIVNTALKGRVGEKYFITNRTPVNAADLPQVFAEALGRRVRTMKVPVTLLKAAAAVSESWGRISGKVPVFNLEKVRELTAAGWVCSGEKAYEETGFDAGIELTEGFARTARWYRDNGWL